MAPVAIIIKNSKVIIPVILYRMLMATAVVGGGPPLLLVCEPVSDELSLGTNLATNDEPLV